MVQLQTVVTPPVKTFSFDLIIVQKKSETGNPSCVTKDFLAFGDLKDVTSFILVVTSMFALIFSLLNAVFTK